MYVTIESYFDYVSNSVSYSDSVYVIDVFKLNIYDYHLNSGILEFITNLV